MINILWAGMFLSAIFVAAYQLIFLQNYEIFSQITNAIFQNAQSAVEISIGLIGILSFWLGILKLIENAHIAEKISEKILGENFAIENFDNEIIDKVLK